MNYLLDRAVDRIVSFINQKYTNSAKYIILGFVGDHISSRILAKGFYERDELEALYGLILSDERQLDIFIDIGANIGNHTIFFADKFNSVIAIEADPTIFKVLKFNVEINSLNNVKFYNLAASSSAGMVNFRVSGLENHGTGHVVSAEQGGETIQVRSLPIDEVLTQHSCVSLIKIDVEGYECEVLKGLSKTLMSSNALVAFEANSINSYIRTSEYLRSCGYTKFVTFSYPFAPLPRSVRVPMRILGLSKKRWLEIKGLNRLCVGDLIIASKSKAKKVV